MQCYTVRRCSLVFTQEDLSILGEKLEKTFPDLYFSDELDHVTKYGVGRPESEFSRHLKDCRWSEVSLLFGAPGPNWEYVRVPNGPVLKVWILRDRGYPNGEMHRASFQPRGWPDMPRPFKNKVVGASDIVVRAFKDQPEQVRKIEKVLRLAKKIAVTNKCRWYAFEGAERYPKRDEDANDQWVGPEALAWVRAQPGRILATSHAGHRPLALMPRDWVETPDYPWPRAVRK
jgi:hypothetical protein